MPVSQFANEFNHIRQKKFHKIHSNIVGDFQIDLLIYNKKKKNEDDKIEKGIYICAVIDIHTRRGGARILTDKDGKYPAFKNADNTKRAYLYIIRNYFENLKPFRLTADRGTEFASIKTMISNEGGEFRQCNGDAMRYRDFHPIMGMVERWNGTLRKYINNHLEDEGGRGVLTNQVLEEVVDYYNDKKHKGIGGITPNQAWSGDKAPKKIIRNYNIDSGKLGTHINFKVGERVRIMNQSKHRFIQGNKQETRYTKEVYRIVERIPNTHRYKLSNGKDYIYTRLKKTKAPETIIAAALQQRKPKQKLAPEKPKPRVKNRKRGDDYKKGDSIIIKAGKIDFKKLYPSSSKKEITKWDKQKWDMIIKRILLNNNNYDFEATFDEDGGTIKIKKDWIV